MLDYLLYSLITVSLGGIGYCLLALRTVSEGNEALVERLGKFHRKLSPGLHLVTPLFDTIVVEDTNREKVLDVPPQNTITKDNVSLRVDAVVYWQIIDLEKTFYVVEDIQHAIENLVLTTLRSEIGRLDLEDTYAARDSLNKTLLRQLDEATSNWGVKITRVEVQELQPTPAVMESLEKERAAKSKKRAEVTEAEGLVESIEKISNALDRSSTRKQVLNFLLAQRYVEANEKIGTSTNSKILFMDPGDLNEAMVNLIGDDVDPPPPNN
ncbi:stomatin-like protein [Oscillatoria sp. FACHB-1406]|uniref:SPFH domain-containing protein n=1 Tax=Oscillatoria sp. FACHB-1406 TaxID=2692846 RepID=UPI0016858A22|nr:stomatin-like protein [Oscillatoria sp. FACHB-1406]MBD2578425.1 paraslipin [Oscillatoria sp. FACHB-1406]